jgi:hypothetical protein
MPNTKFNANKKRNFRDSDRQTPTTFSLGVRYMHFVKRQILKGFMSLIFSNRFNAVDTEKQWCSSWHSDIKAEREKENEERNIDAGREE